MTERRQLLTRMWRPAGEPARRLDDFAEVPCPPPVLLRPKDDPEESAEGIERRHIGRRLENWGMWANMDKRSLMSDGDCMTQVVCANMLRNSKEALKLLPPVVVYSRIDVPDAEAINVAFADLPELHRAVLNWTYVVCAKPWGVAGACGFPTREYETHLEAAQAAISTAVGPMRQHSGSK